MKIIEAKDVANAIGNASSALIPNSGSKYTSTGTIISPPPIPSKPAKKPTIAPKKAHAIKTLVNIKIT